MCKECKKECIGNTPCKDCRKVKYVWLIPVAAFAICYLIGVVV
jgi:hypothetical protein